MADGGRRRLGRSTVFCRMVRINMIGVVYGKIELCQGTSCGQYLADKVSINIIYVTIVISVQDAIPVNQLIRSGTSVGANIREAFYGHGTADFIAKLQIALKECSESEYWIELLIESGYYNNNDILEICIEVKKLLISSINTAKSRLNKQR